MVRKERQNLAAHPVLKLVGKATLYLLAAIGFLSVVGGPIFQFAMSPMFVKEKIKSLPSPDGRAVAEIEVTRGGIGTVWTTRVHLRKSEEEHWTIYETKDSDFVPSIQWINRDTLVLGLSCERIGHISNPDDWQRSDPDEQRIKVRFRYVDECAD